jgi:dihydropyrimidinase
MSTLIKSGRIVTAEQDYTADIYIDKEKITTIGADLGGVTADAVFDARGKYVIPGGVDVHTHMDMPFGGTMSSDDFETGTRAAAFGGTTCIIDFAIQSKGQKMREALDVWWKKGEKATVDYSLHMIITDLPEAHLEDMNDMVREGLTSFKLFMAYPNVLMVDDATIFRAMRQTGNNGALVCMHAENGGVIDLLVQKALAEGKTAPIYHALTRPVTAEAEAVNRAIALAQMAGAPVYIVHLTSADALEKVSEARDRGIPAFAETCPQYLLLSIEDLGRPDFEGAKFVFTPPLREKWHQDRLWEGLKKNTLQVVSTDHCPFCFKEQKEMGRENFAKIPNGGPGVENRLQLLFHHGVNQKRISLNRWVELVSTAPAKMFGLYPRKGTIAVGSDADLVIWDPDAAHTISARTHHMRVDYSMFEGFKLKGNAERVFSRGVLVVDRSQWLGKPGRGAFIRRDTYAGAWR